MPGRGEPQVLPHESSAETAGATQVVDPAVSRAKFDQEMAQFRQMADVHQGRGWWMLEAEFPIVVIVMAAPQLKPPAVICGVHLNFSNYDLEPPSVTLIDPFTREPYRARNLPTVLHRKRVSTIQVGPAGQALEQVELAPLMQSHDPNDIPFLCIPGVREYHEHPAHTGDSWLVHRGGGAGTLFHILNTIYQYGVQPLSGYNIGIQVTGFRQGEPPA